MDEQINYIATHLRRSDEPARIDGLRILERREGQFEDAGVLSRAQIVAMLDDGELIVTWDHDADELGEVIELVEAGSELYLRVDGQPLTADNLGALPEV